MSGWNKRLLLALAGSLAILSGCGTPSAVTPQAPVPADMPYEAEAVTGDIEVSFNDTYLERSDLNRPRAEKSAKNTDKGLYRLIRGAKKSLDGAFYDIEDAGITAELIKAKKRGVKLRLVTDNDNLVEKSDPSKPREAIVELKQAGIPVVDDRRSAIMHHKFLVVDDAAVWCGSTNLTPTSLYAHNNNAMVLRDKKVAAAFEDEFERMFLRRQFGISDRPNVKPYGPYHLDGGDVTIFFSPRGGGREAVLDELSVAEKSIKFMTFSLTDAQVGQTMMLRAKEGVLIQGIFDRWLAAGQYSLFSSFKANHFDVVKDGNEALMHHKVILVDGKTVISGSYNYSQNAENNNNEAFLILHQAPVIARGFEREFDRLMYAAKHNRPPAFKKQDAEHKTGTDP